MRFVTMLSPSGYNDRGDRISRLTTTEKGDRPELRKRDKGRFPTGREAARAVSSCGVAANQETAMPCPYRYPPGRETALCGVAANQETAMPFPYKSYPTYEIYVRNTALLVLEVRGFTPQTFANSPGG